MFDKTESNGIQNTEHSYIAIWYAYLYNDLQ